MKYLFRARCRNDYTTGGATTPINDSDALRFKVSSRSLVSENGLVIKARTERRNWTELTRFSFWRTD